MPSASSNGIRSRPKASLQLNLPASHQPQARAPTMISFDGVSPDIMEAMCTPMHQILPPSSPQPSSASSLPSTSHSFSPTTTSYFPHKHSGALWLGSLAASIDKDLLAAHRISHLIQVLDAPWLPSPFPGIRCHRIPLLDLPGAGPELKRHLDDACDVIAEALARGENVLVHCQQGVSRSAAIVIAYLISKHGMTYDAAYDLVRKKRACIKPNSGFVSSLRDWETQWRGKAEREREQEKRENGGVGMAMGMSVPNMNIRQAAMRRTMSSYK